MPRKNKFPRVAYRNCSGGGMCEICGRNLAGRIHVQVSDWRDDDGVHKVCGVCAAMYSNRGLLMKLGYLDERRFEVDGQVKIEVE